MRYVKEFVFDRDNDIALLRRTVILIFFMVWVAISHHIDEQVYGQNTWVTYYIEYFMVAYCLHFLVRLFMEKRSNAEQPTKGLDTIVNPFVSPSAGWVYLILGPDGVYKIGKSRDPESRVATFTLELPFDVQFIHLIPCKNMHQAESYLHGLFANKRIRGEWFKLSAQDVALIKSIPQME